MRNVDTDERMDRRVTDFCFMCKRGPSTPTRTSAIIFYDILVIVVDSEPRRYGRG